MPFCGMCAASGEARPSHVALETLIAHIAKTAMYAPPAFLPYSTANPRVLEARQDFIRRMIVRQLYQRERSVVRGRELLQ